MTRRTTLSSDYANFALGDFRVLNNVWNKGTLINGQDYTQSVAFQPDDISKNVTFKWDWGKDHRDMVAYPEVIVGYKPWEKWGSDSINAQISEIKTFLVTHDVDVSGDTSLFNVTYDLWLTSEPLGDKSTITTELMVWTHGGELGDHRPESLVGHYRHGGYSADIVMIEDKGGMSGQYWRYIALLPEKDYDQKTIDMKDVLDHLVRHGLIDQDNYVTGYEFGSEVRGGKGQLDINDLSYSFGTYDTAASEKAIVGTRLADQMSGTDLRDIIRGGRGNDFIDGGAGEDILVGGKGGDRFAFWNADGTVDTIVDFQAGKDEIVIFGDDFDFTGSALRRGQFAMDARADLAEAHFWYQKATGHLYYEADGEAAPEIVLTIENRAAITYEDFVIL